MMKEIYFAIYSMKKNIQNSAELRASFLTNMFGMAINDVFFIAIWIFFVKAVGVINGWVAADIFGLIGFSTLSYGIVFSVGYGIRKLPDYVSSGGFDKFMLSPKNLLIRLLTSSFMVPMLGDVIFGAICLVIFGILIKISFIQILFLFLLVFVSCLVFLGISIFIYSMSFLFIDAGSATNSLFDLFMSPTLFHGGAFQGAMRFVFTFLIPSLIVGALPVEIIKNLDFEKLILVAVVALFWFFFAVKFFYWGIKKYESANFMNFGGS